MAAWESGPLTALPPSPQASHSMKAGALSFKNNYAANDAMVGMPTKDFTVEFWARTPALSKDAPAAGNYAEFFSFATHLQGDGARRARAALGAVFRVRGLRAQGPGAATAARRTRRRRATALVLPLCGAPEVRRRTEQWAPPLPRGGRQMLLSKCSALRAAGAVLAHVCRAISCPEGSFLKPGALIPELSSLEASGYAQAYAVHLRSAHGGC